jgi:hypothetical protein
MDRATLFDIDSLGGKPSDPIWQWLINKGPHGSTMTWSQTKNEPPGFIGVELLKQVVEEKQAADNDFNFKAKEMIQTAFKSDNSNILINAIQVCAVIGETNNDLNMLSNFLNYPDILVQKHAKAATFYLKQKIRKFGYRNEKYA